MAREVEGEALTAALAAGAAITRARVADDVEALADKLSPENLVAEAKHKVTRGIQRQAARSREAVFRVAQAAARSALRHPIPLALSVVAIFAWVWRARRA